MKKKTCNLYWECVWVLYFLGRSGYVDWPFIVDFVIILDVLTDYDNTMNFIFHDYQFIWINIFLLLSCVLSIAFRVYLFVGISSRSSFINFVFVSKNVSNTAHSLYSKYIWRLVSTVYYYLWAAKKNRQCNFKISGLIDQINKMIKCKM